MDFVDPAFIAQKVTLKFMKVVSGVYEGVTTVELDNLAAETAAYLTTKHYDYGKLAARLVISNLQKQTHDKFSDCISDLYHYKNATTKVHQPKVSEEVYNVVMKNKDAFDQMIVNDRDYEISYFGYKTLERSYLLKIDDLTAERPQYLLMRVSIGMHLDDLEKVKHTYDLMSTKHFIHASPTLFNCGTKRPQLSSCFLVAMEDDSIVGIYDTLKTCALVSKSAGGIGLNIHNIRARDSYIAGTNGYSNGLVPMLRVFNNTARYVDQGGNKRPGAIAIYIEPWHSDIFDVLNLKKNTGKEENRARDLFYALWIPDLFMKRVEANMDWSLFCPNDAPGLYDTYGDEFEELYHKYETQGLARSKIKAQALWFAILDSQIETGVPYMLYKDSCNRKSNQKNVGVIRSSNLCTEIIQYSSKDEVAVCNLASVALPTYVKKDKDSIPYFDFEKLHDVVKTVVENLNKIIDLNYYPIPQAKKSNFRHRPIGIGVQGLADCFIMMRFPFESQSAKKLNIQIFETIYHAALEKSCEIAKIDGPYETYEGSPISKQILQYDMWDVKPTNLWNFDSLKRKIKQYGVRNSLLVAPMPTASTSQILGFNECFEPFTSNIYTRRVLAGEFQIVNPWLLRDLIELGLWNDLMKQQIIVNGGSIQSSKFFVNIVSKIPQEIKDMFKTTWEISQKTLIDMAADRAPFIDQSQSLNVFIKEPTYAKLTSMHFYGWKKGLKTGMYYLRTQPAANAIQFTVDQLALKNQLKKEEENDKAKLQCSIDNPDSCTMCSG